MFFGALLFEALVFGAAGPEVAVFEDLVLGAAGSISSVFGVFDFEAFDFEALDFGAFVFGAAALGAAGSGDGDLRAVASEAKVLPNGSSINSSSSGLENIVDPSNSVASSSSAEDSSTGRDGVV